MNCLTVRIIGDDMEEIPLGRAKNLDKSSLALTGPLLTSEVPQTLQPLGESNQPILNNGLVKDGGLTELYQQTIAATTAAGNPYYIYVASNGA